MQYIGNLNLKLLERFDNEILESKVFMTNERLYQHVLVFHENEYKRIYKYLKIIIEEPDIILEDNRNKNTIILLKHICEIDKKARIVIKIASSNDKKHLRNSIITLMQLNERTWKQTIKNKGKIIYNSMDKYE